MKRLRDHLDWQKLLQSFVQEQKLLQQVLVNLNGAF